MTQRPILRPVPKVKPGPSYAQIKKAVAMFRSPLIPRELRRANARKWLLAMAQLGDKHVHKGAKVSWSHPQVLTRGK